MHHDGTQETFTVTIVVQPCTTSFFYVHFENTGAMGDHLQFTIRKNIELVEVITRNALPNQQELYFPVCIENESDTFFWSASSTAGWGMYTASLLLHDRTKVRTLYPTVGSEAATNMPLSVRYKVGSTGWKTSEVISTPADAWKTSTFDDSTWWAGDITSGVINSQTTRYFRNVFTLNNLSNIPTVVYR
ncbi:hypothetical protein MRX50_19225, partial [Fusibacter sp. A2]|uniref:hypothetical protein n=1 Tax=Fusibacter sp. A2 TaxID=2929473 RepID=UPI0020BDE5C7